MKTTFVQVVKLTGVMFCSAWLAGGIGGSEAVSAPAKADATVVLPDVTNAASAEASDALSDDPVSPADSNPVISSTVPPSLPQLSPGLKEVIGLAQAQVGEEVLLAYVQKSGHTFNPTVEEVVYLHDLGVSDKVIAAMINSGKGAGSGLDATTSLAATPANAAPADAVTPGPEDAGLTLPVASAPAEMASAAAPVTTFYQDLSPYGSWLQIADYGWCWQPSVAVINTGWRPYADRGRWVWTDCGWYWQSDYSWGWAAFHYGRWQRHGTFGWFWVPDTCWAPAWVSWRYSDSYCGWAPLPARARYYPGSGFSYRHASVGAGFEFGLRDRDYTFVRPEHFYHHNLSAHYLPASQVNKAYRQTHVENHFQGGNNGWAVTVTGVPVERIAAVAKTDIQTVSVRDLPTSARRDFRPDRLVRDGSAVAVFRPSLENREGVTSLRGNHLVSPVSAPVFNAGNTVTRPQVAAGVTPVGSRIIQSGVTGNTSVNVSTDHAQTPLAGHRFPVLQRPADVGTAEATEHSSTFRLANRSSSTLFNPVAPRDGDSPQREFRREPNNLPATSFNAGGTVNAGSRPLVLPQTPAPFVPATSFNTPRFNSHFESQSRRFEPNTSLPTVERTPRMNATERSFGTRTLEPRFNSPTLSSPRTVETPRFSVPETRSFTPSPGYSRPAAPQYTPPAPVQSAPVNNHSFSSPGGSGNRQDRR